MTKSKWICTKLLVEESQRVMKPSEANGGNIGLPRIGGGEPPWTE